MNMLNDINEKNILNYSVMDKSIIPQKVQLSCNLNTVELFKGHSTIYLKFSEEEDPSFLFFTYFNDKMIIEEFQSHNKLVGHGRLMLECLVEIAQHYNFKIEEHNKNAKLKIKKISEINGQIIPKKPMTYEELYSFYDKCGFISEGRLLKHIQ